MKAIVVVCWLLLAMCAQVNAVVMRASDFAALQSLHQATGGANWVSKWTLDPTKLCAENGGSLTCAGNGGVRSLTLNSNRLVGTLPTPFFQLPDLISLQLKNNSLSGPLPTEIGQLKSLGTLVLSSNALSSSLPTELALLKVSILAIDANAFSGQIPDAVANHPFATEFRGLNNRFSGSVPAVWGPNMKVIFLDSNQLQGTLPGTIFSRPLTNFRASMNQLSGTVPTEVGLTTGLVDLYLFQNNMDGPIPTQLGRNGSLKRFWIYQNGLTGSIPSELGQCASLYDLRLQNNKLSGTIPSELANAPNLKNMWFASNNLVGTIPSSFGNLNLESFRIRNTLISGIVPPGMLRGSALAILYLSLTCLTPVGNYGGIASNDFPTFEPNPLCPKSSVDISMYPNTPTPTRFKYEAYGNASFEDSNPSSTFNDLTASNTGPLVFTHPFSQSGNPFNAALFFQLSSSFSTRSKARFSLSTSFTVEILFMAPDLYAVETLFALTKTVSGQSLSLNVVLASDGSVVVNKGYDPLIFSDPSTVVEDKVTHLALSWDASAESTTLFVDGNEIGTAPANLAGNFYFQLARFTKVFVDEAYIYPTTFHQSTVDQRINVLAWCPNGSCTSSQTCVPSIWGATCQ